MTRHLSLFLLTAMVCVLSSCAIPEGIAHLSKLAHDRAAQKNTAAASAPAPAVSMVASQAEEPPTPAAAAPRPSIKVEQLP